jgi:hypothetical protein
MAAFLHRLAGSPAYTSTSCGFTDTTTLPAGFQADICWLKSTEVTAGINPEQTLYAPTAPVTRAQMAAFLHRLYNWGTK